MTSRCHFLLRHAARALGPAIAAVSPVEAVRAGVGALIGLGAAGLLVLSPSVDLQLGLYLIAPFGATTVLIFAVPNSPLAQPWSAVMGNTLAAVAGVAVVLTVADPALRIALAVGLSIVALSLARAVHSPAGVVAMEWKDRRARARHPEQRRRYAQGDRGGRRRVYPRERRRAGAAAEESWRQSWTLPFKSCCEPCRRRGRPSGRS